VSEWAMQYMTSDNTNTTRMSPPHTHTHRCGLSQALAFSLAMAAVRSSCRPRPTARRAAYWAWTCTAMAAGRRASTRCTAAAVASHSR
jgi:hypothetical protein